MNLELAILNVLDASPRALPAGAIAGFVPTFLGQEPTVTDVVRALRSLENKGHAKGTAHEDKGAVYVLTAEGRLRIS